MEKPRANGGILGNGLHGEKEAVRLKADRINPDFAIALILKSREHHPYGEPAIRD
jgi:hypothetical protein